jgi:GntR family transcriptional regulator/MocR family aminotransferase
MPRNRTSSGLELLLPIDRDDGVGLHRQVEHGLRDAVRSGRLPPETILPSTRALAGQLGVSRGVVVEAYEQLVAEGYLATIAGGATRVARTARAARVPAARVGPDPVTVDFRSGQPDLAEFPRAAWLRSVRRVLARAPNDRLGYLPAGMPELREALAAYLNRVRGTAADPASIVISTGFAQGLSIAAQALREHGARSMAFEDPSDPEYREMVRRTGLDPVGVRVDEDGIRVDALDASGADAVLVTPAHQFPTGGVLPPERRAALVAWADRRAAARRSAWILEDDYDAEFRYDRQPIGAIQGLCDQQVLYLGSASKVLAPGLRLGWLIVPAPLAASVAAAKKLADLGSSALDQLAFADFLDHGELDHHLRRMRPIYRRRRDTLLDALTRHLPMLRPVGASAVLHVIAWLPPDLDESAILDAAPAAGIGLSGLLTRRMSSDVPGGLLFGYGSITEDAIEPGIRRLAALIASTRRATA